MPPPTPLERLRAALPGEIPIGLRVAKSGLACALAWLIASPLFSDTLPVLAPLAALFTVQVTIYRSVAVGLQRGAAVIVGVIAAVLFAHAFGVHAWSIGVMVAAAMMIGQLLRFGQQAVQVPVSALLVLALSGQSGLYARDRILETLLGGVVGIAVNLAVVPPLFTRAADLRLERLAETDAELLADISAGLGAEWNHARAREWLLRARRVTQDVGGAREALAQAQESVRYNPRQLTERAQTAHLDAALAALEHASFQLRGIARSLTDLAAAFPDAATAIGPVFAPVLAATAEAVRAFGAALSGDPGDVDGLRRALTIARDRLAGAEVASAAAGSDADAPLWTIRGALLADSARMLREIDPDTGAHTGAVGRDGP